MLSTHTSTPDSPQTGRVPQGEFPCSQLVEMGDEDLAEGLEGVTWCDCERLFRQIWSERPRYRERGREREREREREQERKESRHESKESKKERKERKRERGRGSFSSPLFVWVMAGLVLRISSGYSDFR